MRIPWTRLLLCVGLMMLLAPTMAFAASGSGDGGFNWLKWTAKIINFGIFAGVILYFVVPIAKQMLEGRQGTIKEELEQAERAVEEVARKKAEAEAELKRLEAEAASIRTRAQEEAEAEKARILLETERASGRLVEMAEAQIESAMRSARSELRQFAAELSGQLAEEMVRKEINDKDQENLFEEGLRSLEAGA